MNEGGNGAHHLSLLGKCKTTNVRGIDACKNLIFPIKDSASVTEVTLGREKEGVRGQDAQTRPMDTGGPEGGCLPSIVGLQSTALSFQPRYPEVYIPSPPKSWTAQKLHQSVLKQFHAGFLIIFNIILTVKTIRRWGMGGKAISCYIGLQNKALGWPSIFGDREATGHLPWFWTFYDHNNVLPFTGMGCESTNDNGRKSSVD